MDKKSVNSSTRGVWSVSGEGEKEPASRTEENHGRKRVVYISAASLIQQPLLLVLNQRKACHTL